LPQSAGISENKFLGNKLGYRPPLAAGLPASLTTRLESRCEDEQILFTTAVSVTGTVSLGATIIFWALSYQDWNYLYPAGSMTREEREPLPTT